jgi:arylsulfatase A-like enzyme/Tfp pilus assembly protein PilF
MLRRSLALILLALLPVLCLAATQPNIVLVTLEATRTDRMGFLGGKRGSTTNLDALAGQSVVFERAYAQAPLTVVSHATILSGTYPQTHQVTELGAALAPSLPFLPYLLHAKGYRTAAFVGSITLDPKNGSAPGFARGFDVYEAGFHPPAKGETRYQSVERRGDQVVDRAAAWLARKPAGPFFLWVHLNDPHAPYGPSYDAAVHSADAALGNLLAALRARRLYDDALVVVAADHGESLGAHGEDTHGVFLYDETLHVPLLVKLPRNQMAAKHVSARVRLLDVAPTVLEVAGVAVPSQMQGQSLLRIAQNNADQPVYSRSDFPQQAFGWSSLESWRTGKYLYVRAPKPELYDLSADPGATKNLAQASKATLDTIASQLAAFDQRFAAGGKSAGTELSSSEMQKLASLGYVGLQKGGSAASTAATGTDPKDVIATANKVEAAIQAMNDGHPEKAAPILQQAVGAQTKLYLAEYALGVALAAQQQYAQAIPHLHQAIEQQPDSAWAHYYMGESLLKTGDFKTAAVHLEIASARLPGFAGAHTSLAQTYDHLGRAEDAKRERGKVGR